ncbi:MAG TPA: hypothetical protein VMI52_12045 [Acetobacteraceae bacterium]|nr:hypothetical protein [Acetobacteraceae bacterium]
MLNGWIYLAQEFVRIMAIVLAASGAVILVQSGLVATHARVRALVRVRSSTAPH